MKRLLISLCLLLPINAMAELQVEDAWIKQLPPTVPVRAGYMAIENPEDKTITIVGAESEAFGSVEIHRTVQDGDMMSMQPVDSLSLAPQQRLLLEPNGTHLMLMMPANPTELGQQLTVTLIFADGRRQQVLLTVKK